MTFILKDAERPDPLEPMESPPLSFGNAFGASVDAARIEMDSWGLTQRRGSAILSEMEEALPPDPEAGAGAGYFMGTDYRRVRTLKRMAQAKADNPEAFGTFPTTQEEYDALLQERLRAEYGDLQDVLGNELEGSNAARLLGGFWAGMTDESTVLTLPFGAAAGASVLRAGLMEGAASMGAEALTFGRQVEMAERLGIEKPDFGTQMATAGLFGAGLGGLIGAGGKALNYRRIKQETQEVRAPAGQSPIEFDQEVEAAAAALDQGEAAPVPPRPAAGPTYIDTPQGWEQIKNGIFAGESGGDYNALFGYQNRPGGRFANVKLTEMTVDEALAFSNPRGEYGQWVDGQIGRIATPMGAYQIVGRTLRAAKKGLGLNGDEVMTEALQDQLGIWIYRAQGTKAWEGYRGPRSAPVRFQGGDAPAPEFSAYNTRRGYTGDGYVSAGENLRVKVDYEVVDLASLTRASGALQPRNRARASSDEQVTQIAASLDPARLMRSPEADRGAPIVGPDSVIESGNGRVMAIERAYRQHPDRASAYRAQIEAEGFAIPEGVTEPVLVARRTSDLTQDAREDFVRAANFSATARMSATERAAVDARAMDADTVALFDASQPLGAKANVPFTQRVLAGLPQAERNALVDPSGRLNAEGVTRVRQAMFARAFDAPDILARYAEADAGDLRGLMDALEGAAPAWAGLRSAIADGRVRDELDVTPFLMDAMRMIADARHVATRENKASADMVRELLADVDLLEGAVAPLTAALVNKLYPAGRALPAPKVTDFLTRFAAEAQTVGKTDAALFDDTLGLLDVLKGLDGKTFGKLTDTGDARVPAVPQPIRAIPSDAFPENAFAEGASSPLLQEADDALDAEIRRLTDELSGGEDLELKMEDGRTFSTRQVLDDLDQDEVLETIIDLCTVKGAA